MRLYYFGHEMVSQPIYQRVETYENLKENRDQLIAVMQRYRLMGISAPQVGLPIQLIVVRLQDGSFVDLVNPHITRMYGSEPPEFETCISVPPVGNGCMVRRMETIQVRACHSADLLNESDLTFQGPDARRIQHEIDHLEGTFFMHRATIVDRRLVLERYRKWRKEWKLKHAIKEKLWQRQA